jgi:ABC transport system ATP-binding/permease protein
MKLIIEDEEGRKTVVPFVREEISIGRQEGNTIRLTERNVSRKHARLMRQNGSVLVEDLGSFNGVKVNGDRIEGRLPIQEGDLIEIGDYDLAIENEATDAPPSPASGAGPADGRAPTIPAGDGRGVTPASGRATTAPGAPDEADADDGEGTTPPPSQSTAVIRAGALADQAREVRDLAPEERPKVVIVTSDQAGQECVIEKSEFRVGRTSGDNDLAINHRSISRNHAKLVLDADGTWRILDLKSANGVRVNGEDYADAPIASGDLLEFGHVKVRFVGAGETYSYAPEDERTPTRHLRSGAPQTKLYAAIGGGVALVAACVGLYFMVGNKSPPPPKLDRHPSAPLAANPPTHPALPLPPAPAPMPTAPQAAAPVAATPTPAPEEPAESPARSTRRQLAELVAQGKAAIKGHHLPAAEEKLKAAQDLAPDDPSVARLQKELDTAKDREAQKAERPKGHKAAAEPGEESGNDAAAKADKHGRAVQTYQEALSLMTSSDLRGAAVKLQRALALDPSMADAHKALGICFAKLQEPDKGAAHYEQYLKLKPNASDAPQVRKMLADYYRSRGQ